MRMRRMNPTAVAKSAHEELLLFTLSKNLLELFAALAAALATTWGQAVSKIILYMGLSGGIGELPGLQEPCWSHLGQWPPSVKPLCLKMSRRRWRFPPDKHIYNCTVLIRPEKNKEITNGVVWSPCPQLCGRHQKLVCSSFWPS